MDMLLKRIPEILRHNGYRATGQGQAVLAALNRLRKPVTVRTVYDAMGKQNCDLATIHRLLTKFERLGLVKGTTLLGKARWYELAIPGSHHHHLLCTRCEKIEPLMFCEIQRLRRRVTRETGFRIHSHSMELYGFCRSCDEKLNAPSKRATR